MPNAACPRRRPVNQRNPVDFIVTVAIDFHAEAWMIEAIFVEVAGR
jgi:hypothetical protein